MYIKYIEFMFYAYEAHIYIYISMFEAYIYIYISISMYAELSTNTKSSDLPRKK